MKQLLRNIVKVQFVHAAGIIEHATFNIANDNERREMGRRCGVHQSIAVGNKVISEVIDIQRAH